MFSRRPQRYQPVSVLTTRVTPPKLITEVSGMAATGESGHTTVSDALKSVHCLVIAAMASSRTLSGLLLTPSLA